MKVPSHSLRTPWLVAAFATYAIATATGCGRIGLELLPSPELDDRDARSEHRVDAGIPREAGAEGSLSDAGQVEPSLPSGSPDGATPDSGAPGAVDSGPVCIPRSNEELAALSSLACAQFTPCLGQAPPADADTDGAPDVCDRCPADPDNDSDQDGYCSDADNCPSAANPDQGDIDSDGQGDACDDDDDDDGIADASDNCPLVGNPGQTDSDGDGTGDACGDDSDGDGVVDTADNCPLAANPGQANTDGADDGGDACDGCPADADKSAPGICGCGAAESCQGLIDNLVHRYRFDGTGNTITDSVSGAHGRATTALTGSGSLALPGSGDYVTLPGQLLSVHSAVTIELWLTWQGGSQDQPVLSFGTATPRAISFTCQGGSYCDGTSTAYHGGSWYRFCLARACTREEATNACRSAGAHLVAIESAQEQDHIVNHPDRSGQSLWLGGNDSGSEGQWYWPSVNGDQGGAHFWSGAASGSAPGGAYSNWDSGEPNNEYTQESGRPATNADCAFLYGTKWWDWACTGWRARTVCEWRGHQGSAMDRGVWFTPADGNGRPSLVYKASGATVQTTGSSVFPRGTQTHVALVLNPGAGSVALYINGSLAASLPATAALSGLRDGDNWLGRAHLDNAPDLNASITEVRVHRSALSTDDLQTSAAAGPDPVFLE